MSKVKMAMVGCGAISEVHLHGIAEGAPEIEITAAVDVDPARAAAMAEKTGARPFASLEQALAEGDFDAVDLMLPHQLHERFAVASLAAGKHVLLEKPMAPTPEACARILEAAREADTVFMVAENAQYWPEVVEARKLIDAGAIGEVVTGGASIFFPALPEYYGGDQPWRFDKQVAGGGVTIDTGSHWIRPLRMLMGEIDEVVAFVGRIEERMEGESLVRALVRFQTGKPGTFDAVLTDAPLGPQTFFRITGTEGELTIDMAGQLTIYEPRHRNGRAVGEPQGYFKSYPGEFADFVSAVSKGTPLAAGPESSLGELRTALAMIRSAETKRWEKVWE